jgi:GDP-6-deoxy-D-talose 4-dehydrogenase
LIVKNVAPSSDLKRVLITGIRGFTGTYVRDELERLGFEVWGTVVEKPSSEREITASLLRVDELTSAVQEAKPSVVIHLAAVSSVSHQDIQELYSVNIAGTRNLLQAITDSGTKPQSVILASSANVYGNSYDGIIDESVTPKPENDYAVSKLSMESMAKLWSRELPITIVRPFNYTGVGQSLNFLVPKIVDHFRREEKKIKLGNLDVYRDFSDVRTVGWFYGQLSIRPTPNEMFNISSGSSHSIADIILTLQEITGHRIEIEADPTLMRGGEVSRLKGDSTRLRSHTGNPPEISFRETLSWMLAG